MSKKSEKYDARFDVSQLEEGEYTLEVTSGKDKIQKKVSIQSAKQEAVRNVKLNK